nr:putative reverse transcriptase [Tanacetum cinerariifolium]
MRTRSQSRNNFPQQEASPAIVEPLHIELPFLEDQFQEDPPEDPPEVSMADNQTMAELLRAPTEGYEDVVFLGHVITSEGVQVEQEKISAVQSWPIPTTVKEVCGFLGLTGYYRRFVKNYGLIARPLIALTKKMDFYGPRRHRKLLIN